MAAAAALMAVGAVTSAVGAYSQAKAQRSALGYQASVAQNNAQIAQDQATVALNNGQQQAMVQGLKDQQVYGAQRANLAANGVDLGSGSANNILTSSKMVSNMDQATIQDNAMRQAWGYTTQSADDLANANALSAMRGGINPLMSAATSMLGSAGRVSSSWGQYANAIGSGSGGAGAAGTIIGNMVN